jgi:hypothetical protein
MGGNNSTIGYGAWRCCVRWDFAMWDLKSLSGATLWSGDPNPSPKRLSQLLSEVEDYSQDEIVYYTIQILTHSPPKAVAGLLNVLTCNLYKTEGYIDTKVLSALDTLSTSHLCGKALKKGDIVWTCRQCGHDTSCVQCNDCFQHSDHLNHEVYFYKSSGAGGCCDCGDEEAWKPEGACPKHRTDESSKLLDPSSLLPPNLLTGFNSVLHGIVLFFFSMIVREMDGFTSLPDRLQSIGDSVREEMIVRLHNDDVHSYDQVISALSEIELPLVEAEQKTTAVDKAGYAIVKRHSDPRILTANWRTLAQKASLLVSVIPTSLHAQEECVSAAWAWLHQVTSKSVGLLRLLTVAFIEPLSELYSRTPSELPQMALLAPLSYPSFPLRHALPENPPFEVRLPPGSDGTTPENESCLSLDPFCPDLENHTPLTLLSLMIASSPYLVKEWQALLQDLVLLGLRDAGFKNIYSQFLLHLYPHLSALSCHGIGTEKESLFHTTVQVFSTESIVNMLSSDGYHSRSRPIAEPTLEGGGTPNASAFSLVPVLSSCFSLMLEASGITGGSREDALSSFLIRNQRYRHVLHDLDFAMTCGNQHKEFFLAQDQSGRVPVSCRRCPHLVSP